MKIHCYYHSYTLKSVSRLMPIVTILLVTLVIRKKTTLMLMTMMIIVPHGLHAVRTITNLDVLTIGLHQSLSLDKENRSLAEGFGQSLSLDVPAISIVG